MSDTPDIPPENGKPAGFDPMTGAVHGSGVGAGGGQAGEDYEADAVTGDGYPQTGGEHSDHTSEGTGPAHFKE